MQAPTSGKAPSKKALSSAQFRVSQNAFVQEQKPTIEYEINVDNVESGAEEVRYFNPFKNNVKSRRNPSITVKNVF